MFALDFFCGAGGLTRGLLNVGIEVLAGFDADEGCEKTYVENNAPARFVTRDLRTIRRQDVARLIRGIPREDLLFAGCAPCQPFTKQRRDIRRDEDQTLLSHFGALIEELKPNYVIIENVPGIVKVPGNSTYRRFLASLVSLQYLFIEGRLDAKWFGVPQTRNRWVVIASRHALPSLPEPKYGPGRVEYQTVRHAIARFPKLQAGQESTSVPNHRAALVSPINLERLRATPPDGGGRLDWPENLVLKCHRGAYRGHSDVYGRMRWDAPAPALTCRCYSISNGRYGHPNQHRAISLREAASLQSFPDDYVFYGASQAEIGAQIGNAVPVKLGEALGSAVLDLHQRPSADQDYTYSPWQSPKAKTGRLATALA